MKTTRIFKTYEDAKKYAASTFDCELEEVIDDEYSNSRYGWTTCVCGETSCVYFINPKEENDPAYLIDDLPERLACGICDSCGEEY